MPSIGQAWAEGSWNVDSWAVNSWQPGATLGGILTGGLAAGALENELVTQWTDAIITLQGDTWVSGSSFLSARQALIDGLDSAGSESRGWNAEIRDKLSVASVTRLDDSTVLVVFPPSSGYAIDADETITLTIPASILSGSVAATATPSFDVTAASDAGITNANASDAMINHYEHCSRTGFRLHPDDLVRDGQTNHWVRKRSYDDRHPQDLIQSPDVGIKGSPSPEPDDVFISDRILASDL